MKNILKITEEEKLRILEMHSREKLIYEQETDPIYDARYVTPLLNQGYKIVDSIALSDGPYFLRGSGYIFDLENPREQPTGYKIISNDGVKSGKLIPIFLRGGQLEDFIAGVYRILKKG